MNTVRQIRLSPRWTLMTPDSLGRLSRKPAIFFPRTARQVAVEGPARPESRRRMMRIPVQKHLAAAALALGTCGSLAIGLTAPAAPASAQITVFDPSNYAQSVLTAARTLQQVDQQIRQLQNEARMLADSARNLRTIDFPQLDALKAKLAAIDRLMGQIGRAHV